MFFFKKTQNKNKKRELISFKNLLIYFKVSFADFLTAAKVLSPAYLTVNE